MIAFFMQNYEGPCTSQNLISVFSVLFGVYFLPSQCCTYRHDSHFFIKKLWRTMYFPKPNTCTSRSYSVLPSITMLYFPSWQSIFQAKLRGTMYFSKPNICTSCFYWCVLPVMTIIFSCKITRGGVLSDLTYMYFSIL